MEMIHQVSPIIRSFLLQIHQLFLALRSVTVLRYLNARQFIEWGSLEVPNLVSVIGIKATV